MYVQFTAAKAAKGYPPTLLPPNSRHIRPPALCSTNNAPLLPHPVVLIQRNAFSPQLLPASITTHTNHHIQSNSQFHSHGQRTHYSHQGGLWQGRPGAWRKFSIYVYMMARTLGLGTDEQLSTLRTHLKTLLHLAHVSDRLKPPGR